MVSFRLFLGVFEVGRADEEKNAAGVSTSTTKTTSRRGSKAEAPGSNPPSGIVGIGLEKTPSLSEDEEGNQVKTLIASSPLSLIPDFHA